jgi:hypothetical protein
VAPSGTIAHMGHAKERQIREAEQGWSESDHYVCTACLDEPVLEAAVEVEADAENECTFCENAPAASLDVVMDLFVQGVRHLYDRTIDVLYWADDFTPRIDTHDLVWEFADIFVGGDDLIEAVITSMGYEEWVAADFAVPHAGDAMMYAWEQFSRAVKFETRYVIWLQPPDPYEGEGGQVPVAQILNRVADMVDEFDLVKEHFALTAWWRAQPHDTTAIDHTPTRLGTVPAHLANQPNRMSPAGIPMFYGAQTPNTAIAEVLSAPSGPVTTAGYVTCAAFRTSRTTRVLDLTHLTPIPSLFDPENWYQYNKLRFLHRFVEQLSTRAKPAWEAVDYVPTQIMTEFFMRVYGQPDEPLDGIVYNSAVTGEPAVVLDVTNPRCVEMVASWPPTVDGELLLGLDPSSIATVST